MIASTYHVSINYTQHICTCAIFGNTFAYNRPLKITMHALSTIEIESLYTFDAPTLDRTTYV